MTREFSLDGFALVKKPVDDRFHHLSTLRQPWFGIIFCYINSSYLRTYPLG